MGVLQWWGATTYLISKIFLSFAKGKKREKALLTYGWIFNLIGVPAWVALLIPEGNWIAAAVELGSIPSLILGIVLAGKGKAKDLDLLAQIFAYGVLLAGILHSLQKFHGITTVPQVLELGEMIGVLVGSYFMARKRRIGWLFFMLMNLSMGLLMLVNGRTIMVGQQTASLFFCIYGYVRAGKEVASSRA